MVADLAFDFLEYATTRRNKIEDLLSAYLSEEDPAALFDSIRYSVLGGGKRIRALICLAAGEAVLYGKFGADGSDKAFELLRSCLAAIEMVHAMSLIHDDLPCMDNDDVRRGRPTNHKVYGEALALLAGDALLVMANELFLGQASAEIDSKTLIKVSIALSKATGAKGMVGGQVADMEATGQLAKENRPAAERLSLIHERKTGALIRFSAWSGAALCGADEPTLEAFGRFGDILGLAFQIADDLLDVTGDMQSLGKTPGKDQASGKLTWVSVHGIEAARKKLEELGAEAESILRQAQLPAEAKLPLKALLTFAASRSH